MCVKVCGQNDTRPVKGRFSAQLGGHKGQALAVQLISLDDCLFGSFQCVYVPISESRGWTLLSGTVDHKLGFDSFQSARMILSTNECGDTFLCQKEFENVKKKFRDSVSRYYRALPESAAAPLFLANRLKRARMRAKRSLPKLWCSRIEWKLERGWKTTEMKCFADGHEKRGKRKANPGLLSPSRPIMRPKLKYRSCKLIAASRYDLLHHHQPLTFSLSPPKCTVINSQVSNGHLTFQQLKWEISRTIEDNRQLIK